MSSNDNRLDIVKKNIKCYPDFPKKGVIFRDIFSVLRNVEAFNALIDLIFEHCIGFKNNINAVVGLESRGFLLGPIISRHLSLPFIPVRKKGKLPGETAKAEYILEYGSDIFEIQKESLEPKQSVLIVDDLLATGVPLENGQNKVFGTWNIASGCDWEVLRGTPQRKHLSQYIQVAHHFNSM